MGYALFPTTDAALLAWLRNWVAKTSASPTTYNLTAAACTALGVQVEAFATALAACEPNVRSKASVLAKNAARTIAKDACRFQTKTVQGVATLTDAQLAALGLPVRHVPQPIPAPSAAPLLSVLSVVGRQTRVRLSDAASAGKRGKPAGVAGATVLSYVGATPPDDISKWKLEGNTSRVDKIDVLFPVTLPVGTQVFLTAFWFNNRMQSGPACQPVPVTLGGGLQLIAA